uniref:Uncharacterized protein n=1 Tax=Mucochytrium quahogii TaxID=96639 RepID=A0A7S2WCQ2_9STRA|mmetsp:Transcript_9699/g.15916  ORF Transcript_9699/g.15916 Transcript_9699/m.15916 type:complete len:268 (-) Transcript_9699:1911-2714(-)
MSMDAMEEIPGLVKTKFFLRKPVGDTGDTEGGQIVLVHIEDPKTKGFSIAKKQCDLWEFVWGTSLLVASVIDRLDFQGLDVLEIGGGSGICSLVACKKGASTVTMTDLVEDALKICKRSAQENGLTDCNRMSFVKYDWNKTETLKEEGHHIVIGSDVLFFRGSVNPVANTFFKALRPGGIGILGDPCRLNTDDFIAKLDDLGMAHKTYTFLPSIVHAGGDHGTDNPQKVKLIIVSKEGSPSRQHDNPVLSQFVAQLQQVLPGFVEPE